jgi:hypothetical protein
MATSTQPKLKANLLAALTKWDGLTDVQRTYGWPKSPAKEFLMLGDILDDGEQTAQMGLRSREERYTLLAMIKTEKETVVQQIATERGYAIAAELEALLRADPTVGGAVRLAAITGIGLNELGNDSTRAAFLEVKIGCQARI